jgi:hypothetical protein
MREQNPHLSEAAAIRARVRYIHLFLLADRGPIDLSPFANLDQIDINFRQQTCASITGNVDRCG